MSDPTPAATPEPLNPEELERWTVATIIETTKHPDGAALVGALKHEGTRALRGRPFTFLIRAEGALAIFHGAITGIMVASISGQDASGVDRVIALTTDLRNDHHPLMICCGRRNGSATGWLPCDKPYDLGHADDPTGTLEIG